MEIIAIFLRNGLVMATINIFVLVVTMIFLIVLSPLLAGVVLCIVLPLWAISARAFGARARGANDALRAGIADATAELAEGIHGIAVTRRFGRAADQTARYVHRNHVRLDAAARAQRLAAIYSSSVDLIGVLVYVPVIVGGSLLLHAHLITLGAIAGFVVYMGSFFDPVQSLTQILAQGQAAGSVFSRSADLLAGFGVDSLPESGRQTRDRVHLSAGQRQLVRLARALLLDPAVLILDEVTADVDELTAGAVDQLLREQPAGRTVIVVAHRMETARRMDRVVSIRHGRIVGDEVGFLSSPPTVPASDSVLDHLH